MKIRLGTRKSNLALAQAQIVAVEIKNRFPSCNIEIHKFTTTGDKLYNANLALIGGKGLFVKEIEDALLAGKIDIAVHSMKDVPAFLPNGLQISCVLERGAVNDAFISFKYNRLDDLPKGAVVGTSSSRRKLQILKMRPDLSIVPFRGNVNTRLDKLKAGNVDAIVLAYAGLNRLGLEEYVKHIFTYEEMLPAIAQGALGVESRIGDGKINEILSAINHKEAFECVAIERAFMIEVSGNCTTPIAGLAKIAEDNKVNVKVGYAPDETKQMIYEKASMPILDAIEAAKQMARKLKESFSVI
jgi:hydroxymethylbilane synthase